MILIISGTYDSDKLDSLVESGKSVAHNLPYTERKKHQIVVLPNPENPRLLSQLNDNETLIIVAHGSAEDHTVAGRSPKELLALLEDHGLNLRTRIHAIHFTACYAGKRSTETASDSYIDEFYEILGDARQRTLSEIEYNFQLKEGSLTIPLSAPTGIFSISTIVAGSKISISEATTLDFLIRKPITTPFLVIPWHTASTASATAPSFAAMLLH